MRQRQRQTERQTDRERQRQRERQTDRQTDRERERERAARFPSSVVLFITNCASSFRFEFHRRMRPKNVHVKISIADCFDRISLTNCLTVIIYIIMYIAQCICLERVNHAESSLFSCLTRQGT